MQPTSQNPYPIYEQNMGFFLPYIWEKYAIFQTLFMAYLWPDQKIDTLFMAWYTVPPISSQNGGKMAKINTLFMTRWLKNHTLWECT